MTIRCGLARARASAQVAVTVLATQGAEPFCDSAPAALRSNSRIELLPEFETYTLDPSGVIAMSVGPLKVVPATKLRQGTPGSASSVRKHPSRPSFWTSWPV